MQILNFVLKYYRNMEVYRSGHNGPDSKSGIRQRIVGSNPTASAKTNTTIFGGVLFCSVGWEPLGSAALWRAYFDRLRSARVPYL